jgi:phage I-like protein
VLDVAEIKTFKISNRALQGESLPTRLKVFGWGDNETTDGAYRAGDKTAASLSANQKKFGFERVAIDFDHCTVPGNDTHKELMRAGQPPLIFGYGRVNPIPGDGIWLEEITWTPLGVQHARNFEDISPALKDDNREVTMIHSVALTPNGKVTGLQFFSATNQNQTIMKSLKDPITGEQLATAIGLKADATPEALMQRLGLLSLLSAAITIEDGKIKSFAAVLGDLPDRLKKMEDAATKQIATLSATIGGKVLTFSAEDLVKTLDRLDALETKVKAGELALTETERSKLVKSFAADGKVPKKADGTAYTADELKTLDVSLLQLLSANTPVTVALSARNAGHATETKTNYRVKDSTGKEVVDLSAVFNDENKRAGHSLAAPAI